MNMVDEKIILRDNADELAIGEIADIRREQIKLFEALGYTVAEESFVDVTIMQRGDDFVKIDNDGFVTKFKPLFMQ